MNNPTLGAVIELFGPYGTVLFLFLTLLGLFQLLTALFALLSPDRR